MSARGDKYTSNQIVSILCSIANTIKKLKRTVDTVDRRLRNESK